jgi:class 3 adenylate cyclase
MQKDTLDSAGGDSPVERRLATILMADVFGYARMMGEDEERTVRTLRGHRQVFDELLKVHRGRIFNTAGDAILAEFPSAVEAVRCATEIQTALRTRNEHLPENQRMWFRIGINLGDVIVQGGDLLGDGVNVAARIQAIAEPGGVTISGSVYDQIQNKLTLQIRQLGEKSFKNIALPVRTFSIGDSDGSPPPIGARWRATRKGPIAATAAALVALIAVGAAGYWLYRDYGLRVAAETHRAEDARRETEAQRKAEQEKAAAEAAQKEAKLLAELQSAKDALTQAEASKRKAEQDRMVAELAQREAKLQGDLKATKDALQKAEANEKKADEERKAAAAVMRAAEVAQKAAAAEPAAAASEARAAPVAGGSPRPVATAAPKVGAADDKGLDRFDGLYAGRMCTVNRDGTPRCWPVSVMVQHATISAAWPSNYSTDLARAKGTIAPDGAVEVAVAGFNPKDGGPLPGSARGRWANDTITVSGTWSNGAPISANWTRQP